MQREGKVGPSILEACDETSRRTICSSLTTKTWSEFRRCCGQCGSVSKVVIFVNCRECSSSRLRLSRVRWKDIERLLLLQYPVRCQRCQRRDYADLRWALLRACEVHRATH
jgi:hypothetical protein